MAGAPRAVLIREIVEDPLDPKLLLTHVGDVLRPSHPPASDLASVYSCILSERGQATPVVQVVISSPDRRDEWLFVPYHEESLVRVHRRPQRTKGDSFLDSSLEIVADHRAAAEMVLRGADGIRGRGGEVAKLIRQAAVNAVRASILSTISRDGHYVTREELLSAWGTSVAQDVMDS